MKIVYTKHALEKFATHKKSNWHFSVRDIKGTIKKPYFLEINKERGVKIALRKWDKNYDLRVIYKEENGIITIITFYPTEKGRYIK